MSIKRESRWTLLVLALFTLILSGAVHSQAWPQGKGVTYSKISYGIATANDQYTFDGQIKAFADNVPEGAFADRSFYLYLESGITDNTTLVLSVPYKRVFIEDATFNYRTFGFGSVILGARHGLNKTLGISPDVGSMSVNLAASIPTFYTRNYAPSVGTGQVDFQGTLDYGLSFYPVPAYAQFGIGYRYRSDIWGLSRGRRCVSGSDIDCVRDVQSEFGDEMLYSLEAGYSVGTVALAQIMVRGVHSFKAPDVGFTVANPYPTHQRYMKVGIGSTYYPIEGVGVGAQLFFTPLGRNTVKSLDVFFGVEYKTDLF